MDLVITYEGLDIKIGAIKVSSEGNFSYGLPFMKEVHQKMGRYMFHLKLMEFVDFEEDSFFLYSIMYGTNDSFLILKFKKAYVKENFFKYDILDDISEAFNELNSMKERCGNYDRRIYKLLGSGKKENSESGLGLLRGCIN
jgi:hypothetical protein